MLEIEVKIKVEDLAAFREKILATGAELEKARFLEENTLYDFKARSLYKKHQALRLRSVGKKTFLTFKGAPQKSRRFKIREEYEVEVKNGKMTRKILQALGLSPFFRYRKYRSVFRKGRLKICLDETPVGNYCELEGKRNEIIKFTKSLGIVRKALIKLDYIQLIQQTGISGTKISG